MCSTFTVWMVGIAYICETVSQYIQMNKRPQGKISPLNFQWQCQQCSRKYWPLFFFAGKNIFIHLQNRTLKEWAYKIIVRILEKLVFQYYDRQVQLICAPCNTKTQYYEMKVEEWSPSFDKSKHLLVLFTRRSIS